MLIDEGAYYQKNLNSEWKQYTINIPLFKGGETNQLDVYVESNLTTGKKLLSCKSIKHYKGEFATNGFARIHRSHLINLSHIKAYEKRYRLLHLEGDITLSVSYRKNDSFSKMIPAWGYPSGTRPEVNPFV